MGKLHLWRKHSYVRVEKNDHSGCVWALFRVLNYHRWYNVKKMLPYKKQKSHDKSPKNDEYQISYVNELEGHDALMHDSASVNSSSSKTLSTLIQEEDKYKKLDLGDEEKPQLQGFEDDQAELSTPTLLSLLKADPKLDSPRKRRLSRSGTFPSPNTLHNLGFGRTPSKVENKHTEIWPVMNHGYELRKAKSLSMRRSSSLNDQTFFDKFGNVFDTNSTKKEMKKFPSLSENEFTSLGDHHLLLRKSFSERVSLLENESYCFTSNNEASRLGLEMLNYAIRGLRVDSTRDFDSPRHSENSNESKLDENRVSFVDEKGQSNYQEQVQVQEEQIGAENSNESKLDDLAPVSRISSTSPYENAENTQLFNNQFTDSLENEIEDYNEELEYVKHVLDVLGFVGGEDQNGITGESLDEALDPELFDEIEVLCPFKPKPSTKDSAGMSSLDRKLLFHLIIEALVDIHEKLSAYYSPNSWAFSSHIRAMPTGKRRVVEEVWEFARKYLNWRGESDPRLDLAMAHDLTKSNSSWKNPQMEIEYVGLDLEELIFDELLDEILCC